MELIISYPLLSWVHIRLNKKNVLSQSSPGFQKRMRNVFSLFFFFPFFFLKFVWNIPILNQGVCTNLYDVCKSDNINVYDVCFAFCILIFHIFKKNAIFWPKNLKKKKKLKKKKWICHFKTNGRAKKNECPRELWDRTFFLFSLI